MHLMHLKTFELNTAASVVPAQLWSKLLFSDYETGMYVVDMEESKEVLDSDMYMDAIE